MVFLHAVYSPVKRGDSANKVIKVVYQRRVYFRFCEDHVDSP